MMEHVTYELTGNVALIGLNRPHKHNAINSELVENLDQAVERASEEAHAAVLFGHGPSFSAGLDLNEMLERVSNAPKPLRRKAKSWHSVFDKIARGPIPYVAAIHGACFGGGLELATAAHIRVADETARFGLPEALRGIFVGGGGTVRIQRVVGNSVMVDMMLTGRVLDVSEATELRIVRYVTDGGKALERACDLAAAIAKNPADSNWKIINVLSRVQDLSHDDGLFMEFLTSSIAKPPEAQERLKSFLHEKKAKLK